MESYLDRPGFLLAVAMTAVFVPMILEAVRSRQNERTLRDRGAVEPPDDVWRMMRLMYPAAFIAMAMESAGRGGPTFRMFVLGMIIFQLAKLLKGWAITSLGDRWSFRVLVLPGAPLVTRGPYKWFRHPNYIAVAGELIGAAVMMAAPYTGVLFTLIFIEIMRRRVRVEERALGLVA